MDSNHRMTESKSVALAPWLYPLKKIGEPVEIRTLDTRLRRPLLYPAELQAHATTHMECFMERMTGIEPVSSAWKAEVLPLNHIRTDNHYIKWSGRRDSNSRPSPWQGDALPLSHFRTCLVEGDGFEPSKAELTDLQSAPFGHSGIFPVMELVNGIEPSTC